MNVKDAHILIGVNMETNLNQDQVKAISVESGLLLQAAAGSGKTFVIIEHIIYKISNDIINNINPLTNIKIQEYLAGLVVSTFTVKASNELKIRLKNKLFNLKHLHPTWQYIYDHFYLIQITTMHGIFVKILKSNLFTHAPHTFEISTQNRFQYKIEKLYKRWNTNAQTSIALKNDLIENIINILNNPNIRSTWKNTNSLNYKFDYESFIKTLIDHNHYPFIFNIDNFQKDKKSNWQELYERIQYVLTSTEQSINQLNAIIKILDDFPRLPSIPNILKDSSNEKEINRWQENIKNFKKFIKDNSHSIKSWEAMPQHSYFRSFLESVEEYYFLDKDLTFTDLEYLTYELLSKYHSSFLEKSLFHYIILDEFQDTSLIQFEIILKIIDNDVSKLYLVGDPKQAIYSFRGGELKVYEQAKNKINQVLSLSTNYRCAKNLVTYYNYIFENILNKKQESKNLFKDNIKQLSPSWAILGEINNAIIHAPDTSQITPNKYILDDWEAQGIIHFIQKYSKNKEHITILYPHLNSSFRLINYLLEKGFDFIAQVKIPFSDDSIFLIFNILIEHLLQSKINIQSTILLISYLLPDKSLKPKIKSIERLIQDFEHTHKLIGLAFAFRKFYFALNVIYNQSYDTLSDIEEIIEIYQEDLSDILLFIENHKTNKFSFDMKFGNNSSTFINIMSVHQSKGLEFDHVILAGINTFKLRAQKIDKITPTCNRTKVLDSDFNIINIDTPEYLSQKFIQTQVNDDENARLFYVACTRSRKSLNFVTIMKNNQVLGGMDSWLHHFFEHTLINSYVIDINYSHQYKKISRPIFSKYNKTFISKDDSSFDDLGLICDLSVTNLVSLFICPRMFYFQEILKINPIDTIIPNEESTNKENFSSKKRGIRIHRIMNEYIESHIMNDAIKGHSYITKVIDNYKLTHFLKSEYSIKFEFFGHMINGVMDVFLVPKKQKENHYYEIWDFKTGQFEKDNHTQYEYQLLLYTYACFTNKLIHINNQVIIKIIYLDLDLIKEKIVEYKPLVDLLYQHWSHISNFNAKNLSYCKNCSYTKICF